ncbi:MAG: CpaD family pilus assembly lipoprotein [Shinella sp.]|nr:CpaD family pilus assembly lipoprotein [Shinella sp.]
MKNAVSLGAAHGKHRLDASIREKTAGARRRLFAGALLVAVAATASGCANRDGISTGSLPDDYRTRHPIVVTEKERTIDIPIASGDSRLTRGQSEVIAGFVSDYMASSSGTIQIILPHGSANTGAATAAGKNIRNLLTKMGVPTRRIIMTSYAAGDYDVAPVRLSYSAIAADAGPCGEWPEDMTLNTTANKNYYNFGCANQRNLAAQIADPNDLLGPRRMTPADATQREQAIQRYRESYTELDDM